jgi:hypothetical protein
MTFMPLAGTDELVVLLVMVFLLMAVLRWSFGSGRTERKMAKAADYGLLHEVATAPSERAAAFVRERLRGAGIRATTVPTGDGAVRVLVFPKDAAAAAEVLLSDDEDEPG